MDYSNTHPNKPSVFGFINRNNLNPGLVFVLIIVTALLAFEMFNYSTTDYALRDLLGNLSFAGIRWATILAIAFCGIDFAGIARLFTSEQGFQEPKEVWYLFGAWLLAATMNAILTWWGVSMAVVTHSVQSTAVIDSQTLTKIVPVFVALMVWVIRILIIGTLSVAGDRIIWGGKQQSVASSSYRGAQGSVNRPVTNPIAAAPAARPMNRAVEANSVRREPVRANPNSNSRPEPVAVRPEPTYHSLGMTAPRPAPRPTSTTTEDANHRNF